MSFIKAYIVPHPPLAVPSVGRGKEKAIKKTLENYERIADEIASLKPDTIVLSSPHAPSYRDYFHITDAPKLKGDLGMFGAPEATFSVPCDRAFISELLKKAEDASFPAGMEGFKGATLDHGSMVPLHFILKAYSDFSLVRISPSGLSSEDHYRMGELIGEVSQNTSKRIVYVASGDLSHKLTRDGPYGYHESGPAFDEKVTSIMRSKDLRGLLTMDTELTRDAAQCGLGSFTIMAGAIGGMSESSELLSYEGPFGVGYAIARFTPQSGEKSQRNSNQETSPKDPYAAHARDVLSRFYGLKDPSETNTDGWKQSLENKKAGVFVTLKHKGNLRGCIGTLEPTTGSIAEEIRRNAIAAATQDPRFNNVEADELAGLDISVDVLGDAEPVNSIEALDPRTYGVIVESGHRKGVLLPDLEGIDSPEQQVSIALRKANIDPRESYSIKRFKVHRHHE